jgi:hypothetical protein
VLIDDNDLKNVVTSVSQLLDLAGVAVIAIGVLIAVILFAASACWP